MMNKLVFRKMYIYSTGEKQAKCLEFDEGINVISSSQVDGTDRGKSVAMRSLYHAMGADCQFDDKWDDSGKTYILLFSIGEKQYYLYRCCRLFKFFDGNKKLFFSTIDRKDLAKKLDTYFGFAVQLPNRKRLLHLSIIICLILLTKIITMVLTFHLLAVWHNMQSIKKMFCTTILARLILHTLNS
jgi:hypothetical protein